MSERGQGVIEYAPIALLAILILAGVFIALGPALGGAFADGHYAVRDMLTGDDRPITDKAALPPLPETRPGQARVLLLGTDLGPVALAFPPAPTPTPGVPCTAFHFEGAISIERGRVSFGRFNVVSRTDPYGENDPLASWKLIQFGGFSLSTTDVAAGDVVTIPVEGTVNLLISDPFSNEMLFSARWQIDEIALRGRHGSINARLATNLNDIRVNNPIESPTLASLAEISAGTPGATGVLTMRFEHTEDIARVLRAGEPLHTSMRGTVHPERCIR